MERDSLPNHGGGVAAGGAQHPPLPIGEVGLANKRAQIRGTLMGIAGGVMSAFISRKALKLSPNASVLSGLIAGSGVAYISARQELERDLVALEQSERNLGRHKESEMNGLDMQGAAQTEFEAGVAGLHEFKDKYATTRGDH